MCKSIKIDNFIYSKEITLSNLNIKILLYTNLLNKKKNYYKNNWNLKYAKKIG